ncbi:MAG: amidohydrolase family protein [bacterium]
MSDLKLIDSHVHIGSWRYFESYGLMPESFEDIVGTLAGEGFDGAVLIPSETYSNERLLNDVKSYDGGGMKLWFFPWLNPEREGDLEFLEKNIDDIDGLKFHPSLDRVRFSVESHREFLDLAERHSLPVLAHCGTWQEMASYKFVLDAAEKYPDVNFICAHQGGATYELKVDATLEVKRRGLENVFFDISGTHESWIIEKCVGEIGAGRFLLGSDFPIRVASIYPVIINNTELSEGERKLILAGNISSLLDRRRRCPL